mgnify:CR=1 FL=1
MTTIDSEALREATQAAMRESKPMKASEWMEKTGHKACICCMCYGELKSIHRFLNEKLPACKRCSRLLS